MALNKPINGKVYPVPDETEKLPAADLATKKKRELPEALRKHSWKPGQSGNRAGGRTKSVSTEIKNFLMRKVPGDKKNRMYIEKFVEAMVERAIKKSDVLMKEILDRVEGKVPNDPAEAAQYG